MDNDEVFFRLANNDYCPIAAVYHSDSELFQEYIWDNILLKYVVTQTTYKLIDVLKWCLR